MICPKCKKTVPDGAAFCDSCGTQLIPQAQSQSAGAVPPSVNIQTYLVPSILATVFCCLPFGIVSIVFASKANTCLANRDISGAQQNANTAKIWFWVAFGSGIVSCIFIFLLEFMAGMAAACE